MRKLVFFLLFAVSTAKAASFYPSWAIHNFFTTNALSDVIEQTNTLVLSGFSYVQRTNSVSSANGTYTWNGTKYVFNVTNVISYVNSVGGWCLTNGLSGLNPALGNIVLAADFTQTATTTAESPTWFDLFGRVPGSSLFTRTNAQNSSGVFALRTSGTVSNLTVYQGIILGGTDGTGKIMWTGTSDPSYAPGDLIAIINPVMDGSQRILYIGGPLASAQGELEAASLQVSRTNASGQTHGILAPRVTVAFLHPNGGQYASWGFEMADIVANNSTETGGGKQSLINLAPNGNAPTNMYVGAPEWTNFVRGKVVRFVNTNSVEFPLSVASTLSNALAPTSITFPATTVNWTNTLGFNVQLYIDNSGVTGSVIKKNGTQIFSSLVGDVIMNLQPGEYFSETYTVGTPSARWSPF